MFKFREGLLDICEIIHTYKCQSSILIPHDYFPMKNSLYSMSLK